jgi:hypothetical protein
MWTDNAHDAEDRKALKASFKRFRLRCLVVHAFSRRGTPECPTSWTPSPRYTTSTCKASLRHFRKYPHSLHFHCDGMTKVEMECRDQTPGAPRARNTLSTTGSVGQPRDFDCRSSAKMLDTTPER